MNLPDGFHGSPLDTVILMLQTGEDFVKLVLKVLATALVQQTGVV